MSQKVIIIGGVGSGSVIAQAIKDANLRGDFSLTLEGYMHHLVKPGEMVEDIPVIAKQSYENIQLFWEKGYKFIFALHRMDGGEEFIRLFDELQLKQEMLATFIHPTAYIAPNVKIEKGVVIMPYAMAVSNAYIGSNSLIMIGAIVGHNSKLSSFTHVAAKGFVGAYVKTGISAHIGVNASVREYITVGNYSTLGMGGVLTKDLPDGEIWAGNPAKFLRKIK